MNIALIGKTGSGKSTLTNYLAGRFGLEVISASGCIRKYAATHPKVQEAVEKSFETGVDIPHAIVTRIHNAKLKELDGKDFIIDNVICPHLFNVYDKKRRIDFVFYLEISYDLVKSRITRRARTNNLEQHFENRRELFERSFPKLQKMLGDRLITINAALTPEIVSAQVEAIINGKLWVR